MIDHCLIESEDTSSCVFFVNVAPPTPIYTLSLHDALPISPGCAAGRRRMVEPGLLPPDGGLRRGPHPDCGPSRRSEEHTSELQSHSDLVCRLLLEKKKNTNKLPLRRILIKGQ